MVKKLFNQIKSDPGLLVIAASAAVLRFVSLGYSDFQGDEIKALYLPDPGQSWYEFLLTQRKGPIQFLVTFLIKLLDTNYSNQFLVRIPFAIVGFLAVIFFYKLISDIFNKKIAFFAAFLMATNGFFVAFARIAQYQSFVILFGILALYYLNLARTQEKYKTNGVYLSLVFWALSLLSHYDGLFIAPAMLVLLIAWFKSTDLPKKIKVALTVKASLLFLTLTLFFYIPFVQYITKDTTDYWFGRLSGKASDKLASSYYLFTVYQPIYVVHIYTLFFVMSILSFIISIVRKTDSAFQANYEKIKYLTILIWFGLAFIFWEAVVYISGTHIYSYLLPAFVLIAFGVQFAENIWFAVSKKASYIKPKFILNVIILVTLVFIFAQSYVIFVDNYKEYPWQEERFLIWTFPTPTPMYHLSMFGFPYFRDWENVQNFIEQYPEVTSYSTNERESISRHHVELHKDTDLAGFFIFVRFPQSFTNELSSSKVAYWANKYPPVYTMSRNGIDLVNIYLMEPGELEQIILKGL